MSLQQQNVVDSFRSIVSLDEGPIDLALAALTIAQSEYPALRIKDYLNRLDEMGVRASRRLPRECPHPVKVIEALNHFIFHENGFTGNEDDYYDPRNSYLNDVLDRKTGIPITLSLVYMELAQRVGLDMVGVGLPGHFVVKLGDPLTEIFIDPYHGGTFMTVDDCRTRWAEMSSGPGEFHPAFLHPVSKKQILFRLLNNLKHIFSRTGAAEKSLAIIELMLVISPESATEIRDLSLMHLQLKQYRKAAEGLRKCLALEPDGPDRDQLVFWLYSAENGMARMN
ncbi:MAG: transglutaminase-like domain-containing protein [Acidobacteriia bacterium]|nr:transglutaminase-like domain-containing protein [Terriglobia bacterium]